MKKPRSDALLLNLPEPQQAQLAQWLLAGMTYAQAQARAQDEFHVSVSLQAFSNFYHTICVPILVERRANLVKLAKTIEQQDQATPKLFDQAIAAQLKQGIFERCASPTSTPAEIKALFDAMLKSRDRDLAEARLDLQRRKNDLFEAQARETAKKQQHRQPAPPLTDEERNAVLDDVDDILGLKGMHVLPPKPGIPAHSFPSAPNFVKVQCKT